MEDQAEKMEALKKAYAEIILNTAKEAAARAMASETKALRFHHDLRNTKDEALQMLLRFKHMIDAKTTEAETTSLSQQKRINKLDAQLNETEEVIVDLRAKLRHAQERLEEVKNNHTLQSDEPSENNHTDNSQTTPPEKKLDMTEQFRSSFECGKSFNPAKENTFLNKETELYRNGYTHRIRAIERNSVDEKSISDDKILTENNEQNPNALRRSIRKRKVRCWDEISSLFKSNPISRCKNYSNNNGVKFDEHGHKLKSVSEMNQTIVPLSPSTHEVVEKESDGDLSCKSVTKEDKVLGTDSALSEETKYDKNRHLKFTFSRKRKKDLLSKSDNYSRNKLGQKPSLSHENEKPDMKKEISSDDQNLVEIACQLISLSGARSL